jgi:hypothetical protein
MEYEDPEYAALLSTCPKDRHDWYIVGVPRSLEFVQEDFGTILGHLLLDESEEDTVYTEL